MKLTVLPLLLAATATPAWPGEPATPGISTLVACADLRESQQRLACFDREVAPFVQARIAVPPGAAATAAATAAVTAPPVRAAPAIAAPAPVPKPSFGEEQLPLSAKAPIPDTEQALHAQISALRAAGSGAFIVSLDNGQMWRHDDQTQGAYLREGEAVTITKATLGSYRLTRDAGQSKNWIRVTRIR